MGKRPRDEPDVTLFVGPQRVRVPAFSQILALSSDFFDAALGSDMVEGQSKEISLPDQDPETVRLLLEYISPGSEATLTATNVLTLLPLLHQFQFGVGLKAADALCAHAGSMNWDTKKPNVVGTPVALLQASVDFCLDATRKAAMKELKALCNCGIRFHEFEPLATDARYAEPMLELWGGLREVLLSPKQRADGIMVVPPDPECCKLMWPALSYSAARSHCLSNLGMQMFQTLPSGTFVRKEEDQDEEDSGEDDDYTLSDRVVHRLIDIHVTNALPGQQVGSRETANALVQEAGFGLPRGEYSSFQ